MDEWIVLEFQKEKKQLERNLDSSLLIVHVEMKGFVEFQSTEGSALNSK